MQPGVLPPVPYRDMRPTCRVGGPAHRVVVKRYEAPGTT